MKNVAASNFVGFLLEISIEKLGNRLFMMRA